MKRAVVLVIAGMLAFALFPPALIAGPNDRLDRLEARVTVLEAKVVALEALAWPTAAPTPAATASPAPTPSATAAPTPTPTGLIFRDDFDTLDRTRYFGYPSTWLDTSKRGRYTGLDSLSVSGGILTIRLYRDATGQARSSAFIPLLEGGRDQLYGRYEIRFRSSLPATGWKVAWLLWPQSGVWPRDGEIDYPEGNLTGTISAFMHRQGATSSGDQDAYSTGVPFTDWHTAVIEWTATRCEFFLDGVSIGRSTSRIPNTPMHWVIQSETTLDGSTPAAEAAMQIDYLAAWRP